MLPWTNKREEKQERLQLSRLSSLVTTRRIVFSPRLPVYVRQFAKHYETGEPLPADLFDKLCAQRTYMAGSGMLRQLYFGQVRVGVSQHTNIRCSRPIVISYDSLPM